MHNYLSKNWVYLKDGLTNETVIVDSNIATAAQMEALQYCSAIPVNSTAWGGVADTTALANCKTVNNNPIQFLMANQFTGKCTACPRIDIYILCL